MIEYIVVGLLFICLGLVIGSLSLSFQLSNRSIKTDKELSYLKYEMSRTDVAHMSTNMKVQHMYMDPEAFYAQQRKQIVKKVIELIEPDFNFHSAKLTLVDGDFPPDTTQTK